MSSAIEPNWEEAARRLLHHEKVMRQCTYPKPTSVVVSWRNGIYFGSIQEIVPNYSKEIVHLSKTSEPLNQSLVEAIRKLDPNRLELQVVVDLDLEGRQHTLRKVGNQLAFMTPEQTRYMLEHPPDVHEL